MRSLKPSGNGFAFKSTTGSLDVLGEHEADGPAVRKAGTYFVNVNAQLNITPYTSGGSGFCALDIANASASTEFIFEIFSSWNYPGPASNLSGSYPFASSGLVPVTAKRVGYHFVLACFDNSFATVPVKSATWVISPVSATASGSVPNVAPAVSRGQSSAGPAGFRPKPPRKP